jgi:molybdopterin/thiamine biosynthesis adenylyltransferase
MDPTRADSARDRAPAPDFARFPNIKVIGLGGVGGIVARYACLFLASASEPVCLTLIDGDAFEPANASRMFFASSGNKAAVVRDDLLDALGDFTITLAAVEEYAAPENLDRLIGERDCVLLCVDNHATRKLVSDHCATLRDVCLISGGNDGVGKDGSGSVQRGTYGNVQIYLREQGVDRTPPLSAYHPEIANPADPLPTQLSCGAALIATPQILFTNVATASAMLNAFLLEVSGARGYSEACFDIAEARMQPVLV